MDSYKDFKAGSKYLGQTKQIYHCVGHNSSGVPVMESNAGHGFFTIDRPDMWSEHKELEKRTMNQILFREKNGKVSVTSTHQSLDEFKSLYRYITVLAFKKVTITEGEFDE